MPIPTPFSFAKSIVLIGTLNPKIFQPSWFALHDLIREEEAEKANIEVIHPDITIFDLTWARIQVTRDRLEIHTAQEPYFEVVRDLVLATFKLLEHTPITALGVNTQGHFKMKNEELWHELGHSLAPKDIWNKCLDAPGMAKLVIQGKRPDEYKGYIQVQVAPSVQTKPGIYIAVNDHLQTDDPEKVVGCAECMTMLNNIWKQSCDRAEHIINSVLGV